MKQSVNNDTEIRTICGFCHTNCGLIATVSDGKIVGLKGDPEHPVNAGYACPKGIQAKYLVNAPERLKYPLRKTSRGFQRISWDEALDIIAEKLLEIKNKYGAETIVRGAGAPFTEENRDSFAQLLASLGSVNFFGTGYICHQPSRIAFDSIFGERPQPDVRKTKCLVLWGGNPLVSRRYGEGAEAFVCAYGSFNNILPEIKRKGAKIIVIDPQHNDIVDLADKWLQIEPGRDDALVLAMLNVIIQEELYDKAFVSKWTQGFEKLAEHIQKYTPAWAQKLTGIKADDIQEVAYIYATTKPAAIREGNAMEQSPNAVQSTRAIAMLLALTGNLDIEGGNVFFPSARTTPLILRETATRLTPTRLSAKAYPLFPQVPFPAFIDAIFSGKPYQPRALIVDHSNPLLIHADSNRTRQALKKLELVIVCDILPTATAELADIILPETTPFEREGFRGYGGVDGGFLAMRNRVIEPVGESRLALDIEYELARRMGVAADFPWSNTREWMNHRLQTSGITYDELKKQHIIYTTPPMQYKKYLKQGFNTPSGKVELYSEKFKKYGYSPLPEPMVIETRFSDQPALLKCYPLIGTTYRSGYYTHTQLRNVPKLRKFEPEALIRINPIDAEMRNIREADMVIVESPEGSIKIKAKVTSETAAGVVIIDFGWGNSWDNGANVNLLTNAVERDPITCSTPNHRFRCQVTKE